MSDEIRATNFGGCNQGCGDSNWLEWIIIIAVIYCLFCGNNLFGGFGGRGCCR